jgi:ubiquinone/menaquinone biosynthesis C-methylase UbiE
LNPEQDIKSCCARLYESDFVRILLGESFHPGGLTLTSRLGELLKLGSHSRVLDVACGKGASAIHIAERFCCEVVGIDYSEENVRDANQSACERVRFEQGDSERLLFEDDSFDAIICECAFCTFTNKATAAYEFFRVLKPGGQVGLSDLTRVRELPPDLTTLMAWVACIADAQPADVYAQMFRDAGFRVNAIENHDDALREMVHQIRMKLLGMEIAIGLKKLNLPDLDLTAAKRLSAGALQAVSQRQLGYAIVTAVKPLS